MSIERRNDAAVGDPFAFNADDVVGAAGNPGPAVGSRRSTTRAEVTGAKQVRVDVALGCCRAAGSFDPTRWVPWAAPAHSCEHTTAGCYSSESDRLPGVIGYADHVSAG
jgi:hypothetical protein